MSEISVSGTEVRVSMTEARTRLADLVELTLTGTTVLLVRRGVPLVQLVPVGSASKAPIEPVEAPQPPPPPPPEKRPKKAPMPPRNREVSGKPMAIHANTQGVQRRIDDILNNLGGKKKRG